MFISIRNNEAIKKSDCEQTFKKAFLAMRAKPELFYTFCIETEETVQGFPDVMAVNRVEKTVYFMEFKYTKTGKIKFQPTQPAFYRKHADLPIDIVAYDAMEQKVHFFPVSYLFDKNSAYYMDDKNNVDLRKAYKVIGG